MMIRLKRVVAVAWVVFLGACGSGGEHNDAGEIFLDDTARRAVLEAAAEALRRQYVFPDIGERAAEMIEAEFARGSYDHFESSRALAERLTVDLQEVAQDRHLSIFADGPVPNNGEAVTMPQLRGEGGVNRADLLPDNVGYLEVVGFPPIEIFKPAVDRAMPTQERSGTDHRRAAQRRGQSCRRVLSRELLSQGRRPTGEDQRIRLAQSGDRDVPY